MQLDFDKNALLAVLVIFNLVFSIVVFEIYLTLQNRIVSLSLMKIVRKSLVLVMGGLIFMLFQSVKYILPEVFMIELGNIVLIYLVVMLIYLFKYFFSRQKYFNHEIGEWQRGVNNAPSKKSGDQNR